MFPPRREVLKAKAGTLAQTPLPLLLHALLVEERSATLELKLRNLEKRMHFDQGVPVGCDSNLLHETLGKRLVEKGKLTEAQHHTLLADSAATEKSIPALLLERQLISGFELVKLLQANLGHTLLDAFRWADAQWRLLPLEEVDTPIRLNTAQLVYTGSLQLPAELIAAHFTLKDDQPLALRGNPQEQLKLSAKDTRLLQAMKKRPPLSTLLALPGFPKEDVLRRLYALCVLELADVPEAVDARPEAPALAHQPPPPPPSAPTGHSLPEDDEAKLNQLAQEFLSFRGKDPFDLLGVPVDANAAQLQKAFLAKADALAPTRFRTADARSKAEQLLVGYARALGSLCEPEANALHKKRREVAQQNRKQGGPNPRAAADQFKIRTQLLDADAQFTEGKKRLDAGQLAAAVEHLQYAADIEPRARTLAWLAIAMFRNSPNTGLQRSLSMLEDACTRDPNCEEAWAFRADLTLADGRHDDAEAAYRQAAKINPHRRYLDAIQGLQARRR